MLIVIKGSHQGQRYALERERLSLGRDRQNAVHLDDEGISRHHAVVYPRDGRFWVEDLESTNGTFVNHQRITAPTAVSNNDHIALGETVLLVQLARSSTAQRVVVTEGPHESQGLLKIDLSSTNILAVLGDKPAAAAVNEAEALKVLHEFNSAVAGVLDLPALLDAALPRIVTACGADRGAILLLDESARLVPQARYVAPGLEGSEVPVSRTLAEEVLTYREALLSAEAAKDSRFRHTQAIALGRVSSMMCAPLALKDRAQGVLYVDAVDPRHPLTEGALRLMVAMAMSLSVLLENARLYTMLRDSEEFSSSVLKSIAGGLLVVDTHGRILRASDEAAALAGVEVRELLGAGLDSIPCLADLGILVGQTLRGGQAQEDDGLHLRPPGGEPVPVGVTTAVLEDYAGRVIGIVIHFRDLTRLHQLAEQVKRSERLGALGQLASGIAHEIRNPLSSVQGFVQILSEMAQSADQRDYCRIVLEEVGRINRIVQEMLDFSRSQPYRADPLALAPLLQEVCRLASVQADGGRVELCCAPPPAPLPAVAGSADKLKQVFHNMVRNAIQATGAGGRVTVSAAPETDPRDRRRWVRVRIADTGCGISEKDKSRIFDPFFTTRDEGTGLGLSICQKIVEDHGGRIAVDSAPGQGSVFSIFLPAS